MTPSPPSQGQQDKFISYAKYTTIVPRKESNALANARRELVVCLSRGEEEGEKAARAAERKAKLAPMPTRQMQLWSRVLSNVLVSFCI